jgi:hypothetical protein
MRSWVHCSGGTSNSSLQIEASRRSSADAISVSAVAFTYSMVRTESDGQLATLVAALADRIAATPAAAAFRDALATLAPEVGSHRAEAPIDSDLPVLAHWNEALAQPGPPAVRAAADALRALRPALRFAQNPNYVAAPPSPGFLDRYGYAVLVGPPSGPPALVERDDMALGVLVLGPETSYPTHVHPAAELYLPLGAASWGVDRGPLVERPAGTPIVHAPHVPHETRTGASPLAALYLWLGSLDVAARILPAGVTPP